MDLNYPARTGESDVTHYSPPHRWLYFPRMRPRQALPLRTAEAVDGGRAGCMCHSACEDPDSPPGAPAGERIDVWVMGFFLRRWGPAGGRTYRNLSTASRAGPKPANPGAHWAARRSWSEWILRTRSAYSAAPIP